MQVDAESVSLREITAETVRAVCALTVDEAQQRFVAANAVSLAQALFAPEAWFRAIAVSDAPVGFVMLRDSTLAAAPRDPPAIDLWRFMVDARWQGRGIGRAALRQVVELLRARRVFGVLRTSYVAGPGCAEPFYRGLGFRPTGEVHDGETVMALPLH